MAMAVRKAASKAATGGTVRFWMKQDDKQLAHEAINWCNRIESVYWDRRFDLWRWYRYLTGSNAYYSYNFSSVSRPARVSTLARAKFTAPIKNVLGMAYMSLNSRVYKSRPSLQVCPEAGNNDSVLQSKQQTRYLQAAFDDGIWPMVEECGLDAVATGSGFLKIDTGLSGKDICKTIVKPDEIIVDPAEAAINNVQTIGIRLFVNRYEAAEQFPDYADEIMRAPCAELGFAGEQYPDTTDVIVLREMFHLGDDDDGVTALIVEPDCVLRISRKALDHFPLAKLICQPLGFWGKGFCQDSLPLQRAHDRLSRAIEENMVRFAWPRVGVVKGSGLNEGEIASGSSMFFHHNQGMAPEFINPITITEDQFKYHAQLEASILDMWCVSGQAVGSDPIGRDASGRARLAQEQIDDRRLVPLLQNLEDFVEQIGYLLIEAARKVKPSFVSVGKARQAIDYPKFGKEVRVRAFPLSNIPQSIAGKQDWIDRAFAQGRLTAEEKDRLEGMPDTDGEIDMMSADSDEVTYALDCIVEDGMYTPPLGTGNLRAAYLKCQKRISYEKRRKLDPDRLSLLFQYLAALDELLAEAEPAPAPGPALPGAAPVPGAGGGPTVPGAPVPSVAPSGSTLPGAFPVITHPGAMQNNV